MTGSPLRWLDAGTAERINRRPAGRVLTGLGEDYSRLTLGDHAAALTYYAMLAVFPGLIVLISLLGLFGNDETVDSLMRMIDELAPGGAADTFQGAVDEIVNGPGAGIALVLGSLAALYSASSYIGAFMRATNAIYDAEETRPFWRTIPLRVGLTAMLLVILTGTLLALLMTGPLAEAIRHELEIGDTAMDLWSVLRWPVVAVIIVCLFTALLYWGPDVSHPRRGFLRLLPGAFLALGLWLIASLAFSAYVANFGSYANTYGSLAGVVIFLVWIWVSNQALLLGATFNVELERETGRKDSTKPL